MASYNSIIIGAGHNGLVCATYLARSGRRVLVLEAGDTPGGLASSQEFFSGFHASVANTTSHFNTTVAGDLRLAEHGFSPDPSTVSTVALSADGDHIEIGNDGVTGATADDATAYENYCLQMRKFARSLAPFWQRTIPRIGSGRTADAMSFAHIAWNIRRLGKNDMREFLRIVSLPIRDLMDEHFGSDLLKAALCWDALVGSKMAPRSPNGAVLTLLYRLANGPNGNDIAYSIGTRRLVTALCQSAEQAGVDMRFNANVNRILVSESRDGLSATGVQLANGENIQAEQVISACDPKTTFLDLVGVQYLEIGFTNRIRRLRNDGYVAKLHLALDGWPEISGVNTPDGRMLIAPSMDAIEFAYDAAKYGDCPAEPVIEMVVPTLHDSSLAPSGKHILSANVMYVPRRLTGGWTPQAREHICQATIDTIARFAPRIRKQILHAEFLTPADLESRYGVFGGHWHHTEFAMDQMLMMRPTYDAAQYATPLRGLFLCGAGCHPAGDLTGTAGFNAARVILQ